jgi:thymidine kinase
MFSGKTEELIRRFERAQFAKQKSKYSNQQLTLAIMMIWLSHDANEIRSTAVPAAANIAILLQGCDVCPESMKRS